MLVVGVVLSTALVAPPAQAAQQVRAVGRGCSTAATSDADGAKESGTEFGARLTTGSFGRGAGEDLLVADPVAGASKGSGSELFGSRTRNAGLIKTHATVITESTPGVPGISVMYDCSGGLQRSGGV